MVSRICKTMGIMTVPSGITLENQKIRSNFRKHPERASKASALILEFLRLLNCFLVYVSPLLGKGEQVGVDLSVREQ